MIYNAASVLVEGQEHFQKGSYRNRYHIAGPNGLQRLSIPLQKGKNDGLLIQDVRIAYAEAWAAEHWRSIQTGYGKSPFFIHYADELKELIQTKCDTLWEWNWRALEWSLEQIGLDCQLSITAHYEKEPKETLDLRNSFSPKKNELTLASATVSGPYPNEPEYPQVFMEKNGFMGNLSILDLLFCQGPLAIQYLEKLNLSLPTKPS